MPWPIIIPRTHRHLLPALPAFLFLAFFFGVPVFEILRKSLQATPTTIGLDQFARLIANPVYVKVLGNTFLISLLTALGSVLLGYPIAYFLSRLSDRSRSRWLIWLLIPFWTSYLVKTFAWILVLSRTGVIGTTLIALGLTDNPPALSPSLLAVIIGMVHSLLPLAVMTMLPIMQGIEHRLIQASETLGASRTEAFFTVYLPLSMPGVAAAALLVFITTLGFFIVPALLGTPRDTMIAQLVIASVLELFNMPFAGALSALLLGCSILVFLLYDRLVGLSTLGGDNATAPRSGARYMPLLMFISRVLHQLGCAMRRLRPFAPRHQGGQFAGYRAASPGLRAYAWIVMALLFLPIAIVLPIAFTDSAFLSFPPQGFSLRWFGNFFFSTVWQTALLRSLGVATVTAGIAVLLGFLAALGIRGMSPAAAKLGFSFLIAPLLIPRIVIAVGLFYLFAHLGLTGTDAGLVIGHTVLAIPYVVVTMAAALKQYDWRLDHAASVLGASPLRRLTSVMIPVLRPSIIAAFLFAFLVSFDELTIAIFVSGGLKTTLPKQMWDDMLMAANPTLAAVSFFLVATIMLIVYLLSLSRRKEDH